MSISKLEHGLIDVGGILTETYVRDSLATPEAKEALGLEPDGTYKASIGTAFIDEFISVRTRGLDKGQLRAVNLVRTDQPVYLDSVFTGNPNQDKFLLTLTNEDGEELYRQLINKTQQFTVLPKLVIHPKEVLYVKALTDYLTITLTFKVCNSQLFPFDSDDYRSDSSEPSDSTPSREGTRSA